MSSTNTKIILDITPQTKVLATQGDRIFFRIPRHKLLPSGLKRLLRLERYNQYKVDILAEAKRTQFVFPPIGTSITFFVPVPKSWSGKKKRLHHGTFHSNKPDLSNFLKAMEDALCIEDKYIAHYSSLSKRWVNLENGWIEIVITDPSKIFIEPPTKGVNPLV